MHNISSGVATEGKTIPLELQMRSLPWHRDPITLENIIGKFSPKTLFILKSVFFGKEKGTIEKEFVSLI